MSRYDAVLLDAFGTLIDIDRPFERLQASARRHLGAQITVADAERALRAEMAYYADHCREGADAPTVAALRERCAGIVLAELGIAAAPAQAATLLIDAIAFRAYDDVDPLLGGLAAAGVGVAVVSNWDWTLRRTLAALGVEAEAIVTCGETGVRKPDPRIFLEALGRLGVAPARALHVGDSADTDAAGAEAAGIDVRIVDRTGGSGCGDTIASLTEVLELL